MQINIGDRVQLANALPAPPIGGWLQNEYGTTEHLLPNDRVVVKLDNPITQDLSIFLGFSIGFAVVHIDNLKDEHGQTFSSHAESLREDRDGIVKPIHELWINHDDQ